MKIKAIASDVDGTLLLNGVQALRSDTCDIIHRLGQKGILFIPASGRQYANMRRLFAPVADEIAYLCENGCLTMYGGKMVSKEIMERELGLSLIRDLLQSGAQVLISGENTSYIMADHAEFLHQVRDVVKNNVTLVDDIGEVREPFFKISLFEADGLRDTARWKRKYGDRCTVVTGGEQWLDIMPKGVTKETGFRKLLAYLSIDPQDTIAIGDNDNDVEMLRASGLPVAIRSGKPSVKAIAAEEIDTVEDFCEQILRDRH